MLLPPGSRLSASRKTVHYMLVIVCHTSTVSVLQIARSAFTNDNISVAFAVHRTDSKSASCISHSVVNRLEWRLLLSWYFLRVYSAEPRNNTSTPLLYVPMRTLAIHTTKTKPPAYDTCVRSQHGRAIKYRTWMMWGHSVR